MADHSAVEQALGYIYQLRAALYYILKNEDYGNDSKYTIEGLDDIQVVNNGNLEELVQLKHHVNRKANITDASVDLWKTLKIWMEFYKGGLLASDTKVFLITTSNASEGSIASYLRDGSSRSIEKAISTLDKVASESSNATNAEAYKMFIEFNRDEKTTILNMITVIDSFPSIDEMAEKCKSRLSITVLPEYLDMFYERFEGWWFNRTINHLLSPRDFELSYQVIQLKASDIRDQFTRDNLPNDFPAVINNINLSELPQDMKIFIEQLKIIGVGTPNQLAAASDYKRAKKQRSYWLRDSLVDSEELSIFENRLYDEWNRLFSNMCEDLEFGSCICTETEGRKLYRTLQSYRDLRIRDKFEDPFMTRGSYQMLSNELRVGWHKDFRSLVNHLTHLSSEEVRNV